MSRSTRNPTRAATCLLLLASAPAMAEPANRTVYSVNQPVVSGGRASVPNCPNWKYGKRDSAAATDSNFGCASNSNLAAMIAEPLDLLRGRTDPLAGRDPETAVRAIRAGKAGAGAPAAAAPAAPAGAAPAPAPKGGS